MSTIKVDTIATRTGSGNITLSNNVASLTSAGAISGTNLTASGTLIVTGATTLSSNVAVNGGTGGQVATNFSSASTMGMKINDTNSGNLGGMLGFYSGSGAGTLRANIQNANNAGVHFSVGTGGSIVFTQTGYTAANALDDYEEGTFTPVLYFGGGTTGITYSSGRQLGQYTKIGDSVFIYIHIQLTSKGSAAGAVQIHNLPFTVKSGGHHYIPAKTWIAAMASLNETPTFRFMTANTVMDCYQMSSNTYSTVTNSNCTNTTAFQIAGHYFV